MLAAMETVSVVTGKQVYKEMALFWGKLFGINFALGVATGLTMEFEFGANWSMYTRFFRNMFSTPLAIEGLMAFFMEPTFVGRTDVERRTGMVIRSGSFWVVVPFLRRSPRCMPRLFRCFMWL